MEVQSFIKCSKGTENDWCHKKRKKQTQQHPLSQPDDRIEGVNFSRNDGADSVGEYIKIIWF